jgi:hypothetical protein
LSLLLGQRWLFVLRENDTLASKNMLGVTVRRQRTYDSRSRVLLTDPKMGSGERLSATGSQLLLGRQKAPLAMQAGVQ